MSANSKIEWTHHTVNLWHGCVKVSPECDNCYAAEMDRRFQGGKHWGKDAPRRMFEIFGEDGDLGGPFKALANLNASAARRGVVERVFINSMSDLFEDRHDTAFIRDWFFQWAPDLQALNLLLLTKRPQNINKMIPSEWRRGSFPTNLCCGTTVGVRASEWRVEALRQVPAPVRFLSCEPLLEEIRPDLTGINWVICGGESGSKARAMSEQWALSLRNQCLLAGVPFFMKQMGGVRDKRGELAAMPEYLRVREFPAVTTK